MPGNGRECPEMSVGWVVFLDLGDDFDFAKAEVAEEKEMNSGEHW